MAGAGDAAGMVKVVKGTVSIERDGKRMAAGVGMPVEVADRIRTGPMARSASRCATTPCCRPGRTRWSSSTSSPSTTPRRTATCRSASAAARCPSPPGKIAKKTPESVDFHTPTSVLGVRGTEFVVEVAGDRDE
jgi:hypothetical protein